MASSGTPIFSDRSIALKDGDRYQFGSVSPTAKHTPGHTPEHMAYLLHDKKHPDVAWGVQRRFNEYLQFTDVKEIYL